MKRISKRIMAIFMIFIITIIPATSINAATARIDFAATVSVVSYGSGGLSASSSISGHAFLIITNTSSYAITVGNFNVASGNSITIGTFGNRDSHNGLWYSYYL
ncbi:MAG: hypothetical protein ACK5JH_01745 [Anaerocolumna sp.]